MGEVKKYVTIAGKEYVAPDVNRMKRKQVRKFEGVLKRVEKNPAIGLSATFDMAAVLMPEVPDDAWDEVDFGEVQNLLKISGVEGPDGEPSEALGES